MKLTTKLILAFLVVSLISTGMLVMFTRVATNREFEKFVNDRYKNELIEELASYYERGGSWEGLEEEFESYGPDHGREPSELFFSIADEDGKIIVAGRGQKPGESVDVNMLAKGTPITVDEKVVGILLMEPPTEGKDPLEFEFLRRLNASIFLSALGTVVIALILGTILSRSITRPIRELTAATHQMSGGNLGQQVPVRSKDEIGELAESFNKMNHELLRSFNLRKQMTADIAHELRTPLSLIIGHAEGVHDGVLQPNKENFEIIREEAERLENLVNDLRTLSLADAGELSMDLQSVDVSALIGDIHAHYLNLFKQHHITLDLKPAPVPLTAALDPNRFSQVLTNVLDNALRYTPEGGQVAIATALQGSMIQTSIQDSGPGVSAEEATHLFDRFYRVDESRTREEGGSGLGLAIARSIVEMHKGRIWAESGQGQGLRVIIEIPKAE